MKILIIDSNTPDLTARYQSQGLPRLGDGFADVLRDLDPKVMCDVVAPYAGDAIPQGYDGVVFTGSQVDWCVDDPKGAALRDVWDHIVTWGVPIWGSCNGLQLAAHMLGGTCGASPNGSEAGLAQDITLTSPDHPMMAGRASGFRATCVHRDEVQTLPKGAVLIAGNAHSPVQAMAFETDGITFWGTQYHPELTPSRVAHWLADIGQGQSTLSELDAAPDLGGKTRTLELQNWLKLVKTRGAA